MSRLDSYFTDSLTVNGQVDLNSTIVSNVAIPTPVGSTIQMTSDQYIVAASIGTGITTLNLLLPENPTIGQMVIIKMYLTGAGGTLNVIVSGTQKIDGKNAGVNNPYVKMIINNAPTGPMPAITLVYGKTDLWFVLNDFSSGSITYSTSF